MRNIACALGFLTLVLVFQEILSPVEGVRVRVVKVKKTRHDKRQATPQRGGYSDASADEGYNNPTGTQQISRPQDNPYNAGNRKVDYPLNTNLGGSSNNNRPSQFSTNNNNFGSGFNTNNNNQQNANRRPISTSTKGSFSSTVDGQSHDDGSYHGEGDEHCPGCGNGIPGEPGTDYPVFASLPKTNFDCKKQQWPGYYADIESRCQVFWICQKNRADAFLCPNGTMFNQQVFVCDWWFNVDCNLNAEYYSRNQYIYGGPGIDIAGNPIAIRAQDQTNFNVNPNRGTETRLIAQTTRRPPVQTTIINSQSSFANNPSSNTGNAHRVQAGYQQTQTGSAPTITDNNGFGQTTLTTGTRANQASASNNYNRRATQQGNTQNQGYSQGNGQNNGKYNRQTKSASSYSSDNQETDNRYPAAASPTSYEYENNNRKPVQSGYSSNSPRTSTQTQTGYSENSQRTTQADFSQNNERPTSTSSYTSTANQRPTATSGYSSSTNQRPTATSVYSSSTNQRPTAAPGYSSNSNQRPTAAPGYSSNSNQRPTAAPGYSSNSNQRPTAVPGYSSNSGQRKPTQSSYSNNAERTAGQGGYSKTNEQRPSNQRGYSPGPTNHEGYTYKGPSNQGGYSSTSNTNNAQRTPSNQGGYSNGNNAQRTATANQGGYSTVGNTNNNQGGYSSTSNTNNNGPRSNQGGYSSSGNTNDDQRTSPNNKNGDQGQSHAQNPFLSQSPRPPSQNELDQRQRNTNNYSIKNSQYYQPSKNNPFLPKNLQDQYKSPSTNNPVRYTSPPQMGSSTTKQNVHNSDSEFDDSNNDPPTDDSFDDGFAFNFAKTIVPTKSSYKIQTRRAYDVKDVPAPESITTVKPPTSSSLQSPNLKQVPNVNEFERHAHDQPLAFLQAPVPLHHADNQTPAPTFGKKVKSGRKRNTSNWTSYFYKN